MENFTEKAKTLGAENYKKAINCAESIIVTFDELCDLKIGSNVKMASGFGGGVGQAGDFCGVLAGSIMVLGALAGRPNPPDGDRIRMYQLSKGFHDKFTSVNGCDTDCKVLRKFEPGSREQHVNCLKLVAGTCEMLAEYIFENDLKE